MKKTVLFDSFAWIELFKGSVRSEKLFKFEEHKIIISSINLFEVYNKLLREDKERAEFFINEMIALSQVINVSPEISLRAAQLKRKYDFSMADAIILATTEQENAIIVTGDKDFEKVTEVKIIFL